MDNNEELQSKNNFLGSFEEVLYDIKKERNEFEFAQRCLEEKPPLPWEIFLVLRVLGRTSYLTKGQIERFLDAWRKHFENNLNIRYLVRRMRARNLIRETSKPITFTRGQLKGYQVTPFYLTRRGKGILKYLSELIVPKYRDRIESALEFADTGEPNDEIFSRLRHEILVSEVYIDLIERGNFVHWFKNENELRRDLQRGGWGRTQEKIDAKHRPESVPDFAVCYYDIEKKEGQMFEGEVAVKYTGRQILAKKDGLAWFCYNESEAQKILNLKKVVPTILTQRLHDEVTGKLKEKRGERSDVKYINGTLDKLFQLVGGITIRVAADLSGVKPQTVVPKLKKLSGVSSIHLRLSDQRKAGRPPVLYYSEKFTGQITQLRRIFLYNLAFDYLLGRGFEITIEADKVKVLNEKRDVRYKLLVDAIPEMSLNREYLFEKVTKTIEKWETLNYKTMVILDDYYNLFDYEFRYPDLEIVCLRQHFPNI